MKNKLVQLLKMSISWLFSLILVLGIIALLVFNYPTIENYFIFFPDPSLKHNLQTLQINYEDIFFSTSDGQRLNGWFFLQKKGAPVILLCHGNAGNISYWLEQTWLLLKQDLNVFIFDYRGYGRSNGRPSEQGIYQDGLAAFDFLVKEKGIPANEIIPYGVSLGGAVALEIGLHRPVRSIILEGAFTSIKDMARNIPPFYPFVPFLPDHYNNLEKIKQIKVPKLLIHGELDEVVPFKMGKRLFEAAGGVKYFYPVKNASHNDIYLYGGIGYYKMISRFARDSEI
jgi:hypothetical protein